jgi:hypothetical protein
MLLLPIGSLKTVGEPLGIFLEIFFKKNYSYFCKKFLIFSKISGYKLFFYIFEITWFIKNAN